MSVDIGYGSDQITLNIAEDQQAGQDAEFTVNVDGRQIGGVQIATALQSSGQTEQFNFYGDYTAGDHTATVTFVNNWSYPGTPGDRNLYIDSVAYNGQTVSNNTNAIYQSPLFPPNSTQGNIWGNAQYTVHDTTPVPAGVTPEPTTTPGAVFIGSGADKLVLDMAEDSYQGDAQFTVAVDGQQIGGVQTTTAHVAEGQSQEFDVYGNFGGGGHNVAVTYLNDAIGGFYPAGTQIDANTYASTNDEWALDNVDRNLYVMGARLNGGPNAPNTPWELSSDGAQYFSVTSGNSSGTPNTATITAANLTNPSMNFVSDPFSNNITTAADSGSTPAISMELTIGSGSAADFTLPSPSASITDTALHTNGTWMQYQQELSGIVPMQTT